MRTVPGRTAVAETRRPRVLVLVEPPDELRARLEARLEVDVRPAGELDEEEVAARLADTGDGPPFRGLLPLLIHRVGERVFRAAPDLDVVANMAVGVDNVDLAAARRHGVTVTNTPGVLTDDTADLALALLLAVARRIVEADRYVRAGRWTGWRPDLMVGRSLTGRSLGVVGAGRIGRAVLARAAAFRMRLLYASRTPLPPEVEAELGAERRDLPDLLAESDFVSLHVPLDDATRHLLDADALARLKPGAILVNTARGPVVDEAALVAALDSGHLGGAGLDVFEEEPRVHPGLLDRPDVVLVPHVGSATAATRFRMLELAVEGLLAILADRRLPTHAVVAGTGAEAGATLSPGLRR